MTDIPNTSTLDDIHKAIDISGETMIQAVIINNADYSDTKYVTVEIHNDDKLTFRKNLPIEHDESPDYNDYMFTEAEEIIEENGWTITSDWCDTPWGHCADIEKE